MTEPYSHIPKEVYFDFLGRTIEIHWSYHAILMTFTWLFLVPLCILIIRFGKPKPTFSGLKRKVALYHREWWWFTTHKWGMYLAMLLSVGGGFAPPVDGARRDRARRGHLRADARGEHGSLVAGRRLTAIPATQREAHKTNGPIRRSSRLREPHLVPEIGIEPTTYALRIGKCTVCHDLESDGQRPLTPRENRDLMALTGHSRRN